MPTGTAYGARGCWPVIVIACLVSGLLTASCTSGAGSAAQLPSVSAPASAATSTPASTPATSPTTASPSPTSTKAAVAAAVRAYYAAVNTAISTGDTTALAELTDKGCPCEKLIKGVKTVYKAGSSPDAHWTVRSIKVDYITGQLATVTAHYRTEAYSELNASGKSIRSYPAYESVATLSVRLHGDSWRIANYYLDSGHRVSS